MLRKLLLTLALLVTTGAALFAQGTLKGTITDAADKSPMPFVNVVVSQGEKQIKGATTDMDGIFTIRPLAPGKYDIQVSFVGYETVKITGFTVSAAGFSVKDIQLKSTAKELDVVNVYGGRELIEIGDPSTGDKLKEEDISRMPTNSISEIISTVAGVAFGGNTVRGETGMVTVISGVRKHTGTGNIPKEAIAEIQVILGGTPASIGEAIGGTQVITLKPPASSTVGSLQYQTQVNYLNNHRLDLFLTGPLYKKKEDDSEKTVIGYRLSGFGITSGAGYLGKKNRYYMLKESKRDELLESPLRFDPNAGAINSSASYLRESDFEQVKTTPGRAWQGSIEGELDFRFSDNVSFKVSGEYMYNNILSVNNLPLSTTSKSRTIGNYFSISGNFTHYFPNAEEGTSNIKDLMYNIVASYSRNSSNTFNTEFKEDFFKYGHVGKFTSHYAKDTADRILEASIKEIFNDKGKGIGIADSIIMKMYENFGDVKFEGLGFDVVQAIDAGSGRIIDIYTQQKGLPKTDSITFIPNTSNPLSNYTTQAYRILNDFGYTPATINDIIGNMGILNGGSAGNVYYNPARSTGLFSNAGDLYPSYSKSRNDYLYFQAKAFAEIAGKHSVEIGIQYDQSTFRGYELAARSLWTAMRELTNNQIMDYDLFEYEAEISSLNRKYILYKRKYVEERQSDFDKNLRISLGKDIEGIEFINIDDYDPSTFSLKMFSADDLFRNGNTLVSYTGYDKDGKIVKGKPKLEDFFNDKRRILGAWSPIYAAGYIQDQFYFSDMIFNIGVRVDYYNSNQKVLKDPYLLYGAEKARDVSGELNPLGYHPENIGSDYVVYVGKELTTNIKDQVITGYRSGDKWYNANGVEVASPDLIKGDNSQPTPLRASRTNESGQEIDVNTSFMDYKPQIVVMPRIAFAFPMSDVAQFKASYDIIARRPQGAWQAPYYTYFMEYKNVGNNPIANPNLKPEKITNYELSFEQAISNASSLSIAAYYKETRDLINIIQLAGADPNPNLFTYGNINYKTTKGISLSYNLTRSKNLRISANYTLQYAEGTDLPRATMQALQIQGYPNLKLLNPISDDRRHEIKLNFDFHYGGGAQYNGFTTIKKVLGKDGQEKRKTIRWFENAGAYLLLATYSGTPYTKILSNTQSTIVGDYRGSRLPWQFYTTLEVDKSWKFNSSSKRRSLLRAYVRAENLLNIRNVRAVFNVTGDPEDNGFLNDPEMQKYIGEQINEISYRELYKVWLMNGSYSNLSTPRLITLGLVYQF